MIKTPKVTLIVAAIVAFINGVMVVVAPMQTGELYNFPAAPKEI